MAEGSQQHCGDLDKCREQLPIFWIKINFVFLKQGMREGEKGLSNYFQVHITNMSHPMGFYI